MHGRSTRRCSFSNAFRTSSALRGGAPTGILPGTFRRDGLASKDVGTNNASVSPSHIIPNLYIPKIYFLNIYIYIYFFSIKVQTPDMHLVEPHLVLRVPPPEPHGLWIVVPWHVLYEQQIQRRLQLHIKRLKNTKNGHNMPP